MNQNSVLHIVKPFLLILLVTVAFFSCKKEEPTQTPEDNTDTIEDPGPPKIYEAQIILTVLDGNSDPFDSVACLVPFHEAYSAYTDYYTNQNGVLNHTVYYKEEFGGMPDSQFVSLEKNGLTDTIYIPLAGENSSNSFTHTLQ